MLGYRRACDSANVRPGGGQQDADCSGFRFSNTVAIMDKDGIQEKMTQAYERMLERVRQGIEDLEHRAEPALDRLLAAAREKAVELGELTREEADRISDYLRRDLEDAGEYLAGPQARELADWLKLDVALIEQRMLDLFMSVADRTRLEMTSFQEELRAHASEYHTGEVTGIGTLHCSACGQAVHFHQAGHIPPCPKCHGTVFRRDS